MTSRDSHLRRTYGITERDYNRHLRNQRGSCAICGGKAKTRKLAVDHEHVKGYKKMSSADKRKYWRGIVCFPCNWIMLSRGVTLEKARGLVKYLEAYEANKAAATGSAK